MFSSSVKLQYSDTPGVVFVKEQPYITQFTPGIIINQNQINIRIIKSKSFSVPRRWSHINNTVVLSTLTFQYIQYLHLMYTKVAWVLLSSGTQVQPHIIPDPDYLSVSYDCEWDDSNFHKKTWQTFSFGNHTFSLFQPSKTLVGFQEYLFRGICFL